MTKNKTTQTTSSVEEYILSIKDEKKQTAFAKLIQLINKETGLPPVMWGTSIVGFGSYNYKYESGRKGTAPLTGVSARANAISLYIGSEYEEREKLLSTLGKYKLGGGCLYIQKLEDIDTTVLLKIIHNSIQERQKNMFVESMH